MGQIRRIDNLGKIEIPEEIRELVVAPEGTKFDVSFISKNHILITKVKTKEYLKNNIIDIKNYLKDPDVKKEFSNNSVKEISNKLDDICKIIDFNLKK